MAKEGIALCGFVRDITKSKFSFTETIDAVLPFISEAVIAVSSQSTDGSANILREHTADWEKEHCVPVQIYTYQWPTRIEDVSFSEAYNDLLARSNFKWNLRVMQDRKYDPEAIHQLPKMTDEHPRIAVVRFNQREKGTSSRKMMFDGLVRADIRYDGIRLEHPIKRTDYQGTIAEVCVTPDEILNAHHSMILHEDGQDGPDKEAWRKKLANQEVLRIRDIQAAAGKNATMWYTAGMRIMNMVKVPKDCSLSFAQARKMFEIAAELEPKEPAPHIMIGDCHYLSNRCAPAEAAYCRAIERGSAAAHGRLELLSQDNQDFSL